jgi:threonine synthase
MLVLETALPIKFAETILEAIAIQPPCPQAFADIESLPQFVNVMPADITSLKNFITSHVDGDSLL